MCEDNVMAADSAGGVGVRVARGFIIGQAVVTPVVVEEDDTGLTRRRCSCSVWELRPIGEKGVFPKRGTWTQ